MRGWSSAHAAAHAARVNCLAAAVDSRHRRPSAILWGNLRAFGAQIRPRLLLLLQSIERLGAEHHIEILALPSLQAESASWYQHKQGGG
jgi:hypothetical protein